MDELRARAYLDLLLGKDSRPAPRARAAGRLAGAGPAPALGRLAVRRAGSPGRSP